MTALRHCFNWLQLARVSALPTALSNTILGYLLATFSQGGVLQPVILLSLLLVTSCLYSAGMILNDVFDLELDRIQRPQRPLPSGRIGVATAHRVGIGLLFLGVALVGITSWQRSSGGSIKGMLPIFVASLLALAIFAYDNWLKRSGFAPWLMGACRSLNLLLGASFAVATFESQNSEFGFQPIVLAIAISLGLYVVGITYIGRKEAVDNPSRLPIWMGTGLILLGVIGLMFSTTMFSDFSPRNQKLADAFPWIMLLLAFPVVRRSVSAAVQGTKRTMQLAVVTGLRSIIVFDAALCFLAAPERPEFAIGVFSLLVPSLILGRWLNPT